MTDDPWANLGPDIEYPDDARCQACKTVARGCDSLLDDYGRRCCRRCTHGAFDGYLQRFNKRLAQREAASGGADDLAVVIPLHRPQTRGGAR